MHLNLNVQYTASQANKPSLPGLSTYLQATKRVLSSSIHKFRRVKNVSKSFLFNFWSNDPTSRPFARLVASQMPPNQAQEAVYPQDRP